MIALTSAIFIDGKHLVNKQVILIGTALTCRRQINEDISQVRNTQVMADKRDIRTTMTLTDGGHH